MSVYSKHIKHFFLNFSGIVPDHLISLYPKIILLPTYHLVSNSIPDHIRHLYTPKTKKEFIKELDFILKFYKPIDLNELIGINHTTIKIKENLFHLSFDDGLRECYDIVAPILKEKGIPATFFINPDFVGNKDLMFRYKASLLITKIKSSNNHKLKKLIPEIKSITYPHRSQLDQWAETIGINYTDYLLQQKPYLDEEQIKKLISDGFTIGAHSINHPEYSHIPYEEQIRQTEESITYVANTFKTKTKAFAFPFNDEFVSKKFFDRILNPTNPIADLTFGVAGIKRDYHPHHFQRIPMENNFSGSSTIKGEYLYYSLKALIGKNKIERL